MGDLSPSVVQSHDPVISFEDWASQQVAMVMHSLPQEPQVVFIPHVTELCRHKLRNQSVTKLHHERQWEGHRERAEENTNVREKMLDPLKAERRDKGSESHWEHYSTLQGQRASIRISTLQL